MKILFLLAMMLVAGGTGTPGQPAAGTPPSMIDPRTGVPNGIGIGTGLPLVGPPPQPLFAPPAFSPPAIPPAEADAQALLGQAQSFTTNGKYEQALQCYRQLEAEAMVSSNSAPLITALPGWVKLGEKYPAAREALTDIRDRDTDELTQGQGNLPQLQEVAGINEACGNDAATVGLFKSLRQKHPDQAKDWFLFVEPALLQGGEYQLCLECVGNPEVQFDILRRMLKQHYRLEAGIVERREKSRRQALELLQQPGRPPVPLYMLRPSPGEGLGRWNVTNYFGSHVAMLVDILVHTGHQELADQLRSEADEDLTELHPPAGLSGAEEATKAADRPSGAAEVVCDTPRIIAPSNQFFGPVIELTLKMNDSGLSDGLNLDFGTVVSRHDLKAAPGFFNGEIPEEGIALHTLPQVSQVCVFPPSLISKGISFIYGMNPIDQVNQAAWEAARPPAWLTLPRAPGQDPSHPFNNQVRVPRLPALFGFQTSRGNAGLLQITSAIDNPRGMTVRYKLLHNPNAPVPPPDSPEDWSPALTPGKEPDVKKIQSEIGRLVSSEHYEAALERLVWCYDHALQYGETEFMRLHNIQAWGAPLVRCYPRTREVVTGMRERTLREFSVTDAKAGRQLHEMNALSSLLNDEDAIVALFKTIDRQAPQLARKGYGDAENALAHHGDYTLCIKYLGDPQVKFDGICAARQTVLHSQDNVPAAAKESDKETIGAMNAFFAKSGMPHPPQLITMADEIPKHAHDKFVEDTRQLIEILLATGHGADAEKIQARAVLVGDDPQLKSAITDAERKLAR